MPSVSDIVKDSVVEFSRLQDWMILAKKNNDLETYEQMYKRYIELKVILTTAGVNLTEQLDRIKE
ncbi:MAG: hypothetical protein K2G51_01395 [Lachnospiraceae bacterium]|nr:hypothetical protein [Lachnospiraceae bacterium]